MNIKENILLAPYTSFKIGGPAKFFVEVKSEEEFIEALKYAKENNLEYFVLAGGNNVLVSDKGFDGLVIRIQCADCKLDEDKIQCSAGCTLGSIVGLAREDGLSGLEWAVGIPGTVGGSIRGNAGAFTGEMKDSIENVRAIDLENDFSLVEFEKDDCQFEYRNSIFKKNRNLIILSAILSLEKSDPEIVKKIMLENIAKRKYHQDAFPSAGSFFKNPQAGRQELVEEFEHDTGKKCHNSEKRIPAGWLIEGAGLKGKKVGGAQVSEKNANRINNVDKATAEDVIMLVSVIKQRVRTKYSVQLEEEVQFIGF